MRVLLTGASGYIGSVLAPKLAINHDVVTLDIGWFGGRADLKRDIREIMPEGDPAGCEAVIHLAAVANDPCGELDARLTWETNVLGTMNLLAWAARSGVRQFIYASSASVYGLRPEDVELTETDALAPVSDYNKTKQCAERVCLSYSEQMSVQIVRAATVCGFSPRMRLDTIVNMLTYQALSAGEIMVHQGPNGKALMRPNIHIEDLSELYIHLLEHPGFTGIFNAGFENLSILQTARLIQERIRSKINFTEVPDKRSYRIGSGKILLTGFTPEHTVERAIGELHEKWRSGELVRTPMSSNLHWMKENGWAACGETR